MARSVGFERSGAGGAALSMMPGLVGYPPLLGCHPLSRAPPPRPHHEIPNLTTTTATTTAATTTTTTTTTTTAHQVGDTVGVTLDGGDGPILAASFLGIVITFALGAYFTFN